MYKLLKLLVIIFSIGTLLFGLNSCDSTGTVDYKQDYYVEAYLFVDHPVEGIKVMTTQPINKKFSYDNSQVKNASVSLICDEVVMPLIYRDGDEPGYYLPNTSYHILPETTYKLVVKTPDGKVLTGETHTPSRFEWAETPKDMIYYPKDTMNLKSIDSLDIGWTKGKNAWNFYLIETICHDTLDYGKYINPSSLEKNRRTYNFFAKSGDQSGYYNNITNWAMVANTKTPTVWLAFKWFGKHTLRIYSPDKNMMNWFLNYAFTGTTYTDPNCNSINGGYGVFGSAAYISSELFLVKNQY